MVSVLFLLLLFGVIPIGAVLLRASVNITNRFLRHAQPEPKIRVQSAEHSRVASDDVNPYRAPAVQDTAVVEIAGGAIPEPRFLRACLIILIACGCSVIGGVVVARSLGVRLRIQIWMMLNPAVIGVFLTLVLKYMLPATWGRAAVVSFMNLVLVTALWVVAYAVVLLAAT